MRIHITGASGSGTSTLGAALAADLGGLHFDADDYYWLATDPPFTTKRDPNERLSLLLPDLSSSSPVVLAGSIVGWGQELEDSFDLIVFLYLDAEIRVERLRTRETKRFSRVDAAFLEWAAQYDWAPAEGRSLARHRDWLNARASRVIEIHGDLTVEERLACILREAPNQAFNTDAPQSALLAVPRAVPS